MESNYAAIAASPLPRATHWSLDSLGNRSGGNAVTGSVTRTGGDFNFDGVVDESPRLLHHHVDASNQITALSEYSEGDAPIPTPTPLQYDPAGNLVCDGFYYYQYDAWNRLVQVNNIGSAMLAIDGPTRGKILSGDLDSLVCRYTYDGLGRLIRKDNPVVTGLSGIGIGGGTSTSYLQTKDYYYDGVRQILEVGRRVHTIESVDPATGGMLSSPHKTRHAYFRQETIEEYEFTTDACGNDV